MKKSFKLLILVIFLAGVISAPFMRADVLACLDLHEELYVNVKEVLAGGSSRQTTFMNVSQSASLDTRAETVSDYSSLKKDAVEALFERYGFNRAVQSNIDKYTEGKWSFSRRLSRAGKYVDLMSSVFIKKNMPPELAFLPLIESGFEARAYSEKSAVGMWQFMPATAKMYGLKIDPWVDERRDPVKSTEAASEYLGDMYKRFGDWNLALAAYNAGEGKIGRAIKKYKKDDYWQLRRTKFLARETKNYVPAFVAATAIAIYPEKYGITDIKHLEPFSYDEVLIDAPMDLETVAAFTGVSLETIKELNPELKHWCTPLNVDSYKLRIPEGTKEAFAGMIHEAGEEEIFNVRVYRVKNGDTVGKIAVLLNSSIQAIVEMNSLGKDADIFAGRDILVPINRGEKVNGDEIVYFKPVIKSSSL